jgi:preprotein translocase subunit SecB
MTEMPENEQDNASINTLTGQFSIQKIYAKDISFETPHSPEIFSAEWAPNVNMQLSSESLKINENITEVVLTVTVTTMLGDKTAYLIELHIAGVFLIKEFPPDVIEHMAATVCPNILFPFAREMVSDLVTRGGFPQLLLAPVNFEALYAQQKKELAIKQAKSEKTTDIKH